jgi:type IV pilus assembly protein PilY1
VDYSTQFGWYMDLPVDGERVVYESIAIKDRILFTTLIPTDPAIVDPCVPSVAGWLMEVDAINGSSPDSVVFDANNDGDFDDSDAVVLAGNTVQVAGIQPSSGAPLPPSIIRVEGGGSGSTGASGTLKGIVSDSRGELTEFVHQAPRSRTSWRRLN